MWRRGERLYALLVFLVVALEALALGGLVWVFSGRLLGVFDYPTARLHLLRALLLTALALVVLGAYVLLYHAYTALKEARDKALYERYLFAFTEALLSGTKPPPPPWPEPALEALLHLRETLKGEMGEKVARWLRKGRPPWAFRLKSQ